MKKILSSLDRYNEALEKTCKEFFSLTDDELEKIDNDSSLDDDPLFKLFQHFSLYKDSKN